MSLDKLKTAIATQRPITFTYNKPGKTPGLRRGNPHAVFILKKKDESESTKVHVVQVGGVSDSGQEFPSWRMFDLMELGEVEIDDTQGKFQIFDNYNPESDMYKFVISKV